MLDSATLSTSSSSEEEEEVVRDNGKEPDPSRVPYEFVKMGEIITIGRPRRKFDVSFYQGRVHQREPSSHMGVSNSTGTTQIGRVTAFGTNVKNGEHLGVPRGP